MITFREVKPEDFERVVELENECFINPYSREELAYEFNDNPVNKILVAQEDDKIVGFIDFLVTFNSATIMQVCVTKSCRGKGIGTKLLKEMENSFPKEIDDMVETITLEVRESNVPALNLYIKDGYEKVVIKHKYYKDGENAIYMLKRL